MQGRIDPPSSANRLTVAELTTQARTGEIWVMEDLGRIIACMILTPAPGHLSLGKLATDPAFRRRGLARQMIRHAESRARAQALPALQLETRLELEENHQAFRTLGFAETARSSHPGYDRLTSIVFTKRLR
ncbi:MAG: GNAT family N-acetyltransferase [Rhodobacteraceae bacterium]|nr:GNAT family N-acetyltransferase [Paracoccaceae bacterium]